MKRALLLLPAAATAGAIAVNLSGFVMGGPRHWWELVVTMGYLICWGIFFARCTVPWQRAVSWVWWIASAVCCAACFAVVTFGWDGSLLMLPALGLVTPLSGLGVLTGTNYPAFYGMCTLLSVGAGILCGRRVS